MKLKTLKDLEYSEGLKYNGDLVVNVIELRELALEHVKDIRNKITGLHTLEITINDKFRNIIDITNQLRILHAQKTWIIYFFNLKEDK